MRTSVSRACTITLLLLPLGLASAVASGEEAAPPFANRMALIDAVRHWEYGSDRRPLLELRMAVQAGETDPEERSEWARALSDALDDSGTPEGRAALCEPLGWVGGDREVAALAPLLREEALFLAARGALEAIASRGAKRILREAARDVDYPQRAGVLQSLGRLGDAEAIPLMVEEWDSGAASARSAALEGLALMQSGKACRQLAGWEAGVPADLRTAWADAVLDCLASAEWVDASVDVALLTERLTGPSSPDHIRRSAFALEVSSAPAEARSALLLRYLSGDDPVMQEAALQVIREPSTSDALRESLAPSLESLPVSVQRDLIPLLARAPSPAVLPSLEHALEAEDPGTRAAAAAALARSPSARSAEEMLERLATEPDPEVLSALFASLSRVPAAGTDDLLVQALAESATVSREHLIQILVARQVAAATPVLLELAAGDDLDLAAEALQALGELGDPETGRPLLELMAHSPTAADQSIRSALVRIAGRLEPPRVDWLLSAWEEQPPSVQAGVMPVLPDVGGEMALAAARDGLGAESPEVRAAALRALCDWPDPDPVVDLLSVAATPQSELEVWLALGGVARLLGAEGAAGRDAQWREAFALASRPEERKALLGALGRRPRLALRDDVLALRGDPDLAEEAVLALAAMARDPATPRPVQLDLWQAVLASRASDIVRNEALEVLVGAEEVVPLTAPPGVERRWRRTEESVALLQGEEVLWAFEFGSGRSKPFFHPLALPGTPPLTAVSPADHPWHYGLWFSWKFIDEVNYWEEDRETGLSAGTTSWKPPKIDLGHDASARFEMNLTYHPAEGHPVLREVRTVEVSPPQADGTYSLDWTMTFTALTDVVLDRTPLPSEPGGQGWGGYAGLSARLSTELTVREASLTAGVPDWADDRIRQKAEAMDYHGVVDGHRLGLAILDHPLNRNAPTPWYAIRSEEMSFFSPAVICFGPHRMGAGESLTLRYRVWVHPDAWEGDRLRQAYREYTDE